MVPDVLAGTRADRLAGGLVGLLVGDALGVPYEFTLPEAMPPRAMIDYLPPPIFRRSHRHVPAGTWSDDGAQALALLASVLERGRLELADFAERLVRWYHEGYLAVDGYVFDCGIQTVAAIGRLGNGVPPASAGAAGERANGNGALMRVLPLVLWHRGGIAALIEDAHRQCLPTHGHPRSQVCCALNCLWARALLEGSDDGFDDAVAALQAHYAGDRVFAGELALVLGATEREHPRGSGYVVDTLWSARHAFAGSVGYAGAVRAAIAFGHDTDTTGCVAGGLAGLRSGLSGIPAAWRNGLRGADLYVPLLDALLAHADESALG